MNEILNMIFERRSTRAYLDKPIGASTDADPPRALQRRGRPHDVYSNIDITDDALKRCVRYV
jgi:nitroreductase